MLNVFIKIRLSEFQISKSLIINHCNSSGRIGVPVPDTLNLKLGSLKNNSSDPDLQVPHISNYRIITL